MADDAIVSTTVTVLPDEIAKNFTGSMSVAPAGADEKWYYKLTSIPTTTNGVQLIAGNYIDYTAVGAASSPEAVATGDLVKFLFIQNQSTADGIYITLDGGNVAHTTADGIFIGPSQTFTIRCPNTTVANIKAISADVGGTGGAAVTAIVCALLDDISV